MNKRSSDPNCNRQVDVLMKTGDVWTSELATKTALKEQVSQENQNSFDSFYNYAEFCGQQVIYVDVFTDLGVEEFHG